MISVLSTTERTDQLSTSRDVLTVVSSLYDRATVVGRTSTYGRTSEAVCCDRNTALLLHRACDVEHGQNATCWHHEVETSQTASL
jgi:hypothetical protein